jgi:hypothetical protein
MFMMANVYELYHEHISLLIKHNELIIENR